MQGGIGDVNGAFEMVKFMGHLSTKYSLIPEKVNYPSLNLQISYYALRPEVMESLYHMYRVFKNPGFQEFGFEIVRRIENLAKVECGYAIISDVRQEKIYEDHMESFLLSETLKYAYLLFDEENLVHKKNMVFTTEAHPFPVIPRIPHKWKQNSRYENLVPTQKYNPLLEECNVKQYQNMRMKLFFSPASTGFNFLI
ncbi:ER degradation-enhancing alpha-mannosidase-like protein 1 [Coelomomyces lativittatus]|nr:ER degradation-enhancing alpha-mannosidase-like protein 1 [Coelomomyces lativittatus]